jgi:hypothetical protein
MATMSLADIPPAAAAAAPAASALVWLITALAVWPLSEAFTWI